MRILAHIVATVVLFGLLGLAARAEAPLDPKYWAFKPLQSVVPPVSKPNPIDAYVHDALHARGLSMSPPASPEILIRRLYLDVLGLPPTPDEVADFTRDPSPAAYAKLVDTVLASPHYGERWARHWLDVVRFAETNGFETNTPRPNAWPYRDYVIRALNEDIPYTQFIREQLAGDTLGVEAATGFLVGGPWDEVKSPDIVLTRNQRDNELHDMVSTIGVAFLGITVGCAKCHDHKFDPISAKDYFAMRAIVQGVQHGEREMRPPDAESRLQRAKELLAQAADVRRALYRFAPLADPASNVPARPAVSPRENVEHFAPVMARALRITIQQTNGGEPCIDELEVFTAGSNSRNIAADIEGGRASASSEYPNNELHKTKHLNDGWYGNPRSWIPESSGESWAQVDFATPELVDHVVWSRDRDGAFGDRLATVYRIEVQGEDGAWQSVAHSGDRAPFDPEAKPTTPWANLDESSRAKAVATQARAEALEKEARALKQFPRFYAGRFEEPEPTRLLYRGDPMLEREEVAPAAPLQIAPTLTLPANAPESMRRLALAEWLGNPQNPLTPRVAVNRIWLHHFGRGLVETPGDFGAMGAPPSHPELLDWLAREFIDGGWRMKPIHRLILLSETYRQSSAPREEALAKDAEAKFLWRFPPARLEAEVIRDQMLVASGKLDKTMGGPGYEVFEPNDNYVRVYEPKKEFGPAEFRRMIYQNKPRKEQDDTFGAFDCPDATQSTARRNRSTTPLQALGLLNSPFVLQQAEYFAERLSREGGADPRAQAEAAYKLVFCRTPQDEERDSAAAFIEAEGLAAFCRALYNASEFLYLN